MNNCKLKYPPDPICSGELNEYHNLLVCEKHARVLQEVLLLLSETDLTKAAINALTPTERLLKVAEILRRGKVDED